MSTPNIFSRLWYRWKALRLPWRRTFLVGHDLAGNTFWEFKDALHATRFRRIMKHARTKAPGHWADVKISPQWHQWLRHTRPDPPTLAEQQFDVSRQARMKQLAAEADERWKSVPSYLDAPSKQQPQPAIGVLDPGGKAPPTEGEQKQGVRNAVESGDKVAAMQEEGENVDEGRFKGEATKERRKREREENPWQRQQQGAPGENWQPATWSPGVAQRR